MYIRGGQPNAKPSLSTVQSLQVHCPVAVVFWVQLVRVLEKECSGRRIARFKPDGSAKVAQKEGVDVGAPCSQQSKRRSHSPRSRAS